MYVAVPYRLSIVKYTAAAVINFPDCLVVFAAAIYIVVLSVDQPVGTGLVLLVGVAEPCVG